MGFPPTQSRVNLSTSLLRSVSCTSTQMTDSCLLLYRYVIPSYHSHTGVDHYWSSECFTNVHAHDHTCRVNIQWNLILFCCCDSGSWRDVAAGVRILMKVWEYEKPKKNSWKYWKCNIQIRLLTDSFIESVNIELKQGFRQRKSSHVETWKKGMKTLNETGRTLSIMNERHQKLVTYIWA